MPFKPGQSGNPAGRKPSTARKELETLLDKTWPVSKREAALSNLVTMAEAGDLDAVKLLLAYTYGKPVDRKDVTLTTDNWIFDPTATDASEADAPAG
jgi:Family of unknown function (DUF5681)